MITVAILINGNPIMARSANNIGKRKENKYKCDDGTIIEHNPDDGAVALAKKMLDTIKEVKEVVEKCNSEKSLDNITNPIRQNFFKAVNEARIRAESLFDTFNLIEDKLACSISEAEKKQKLEDCKEHLTDLKEILELDVNNVIEKELALKHHFNWRIKKLDGCIKELERE